MRSTFSLGPEPTVLSPGSCFAGAFPPEPSLSPELLFLTSPNSVMVVCVLATVVESVGIEWVSLGLTVASEVGSLLSLIGFKGPGDNST